MRSSNENVQRKRSVDGDADLDCLIELIAARHDDEDVDVAVGSRRAIRVRTEQNDFLRLKPLGHLPREASNGRLGNLRPAIPAAGARFNV